MGQDFPRGVLACRDEEERASRKTHKLLADTAAQGATHRSRALLL